MITVTCAIIEKDGKVLCAQRSDVMPLPLKWEFPGGKLEDGEDPEEFRTYSFPLQIGRR